MGGALGNASISKRLAISSAIVSAVGEAAGVAVACGTSTKSAFSDRGDWRGSDVERRGEERRGERPDDLVFVGWQAARVSGERRDG